MGLAAVGASLLGSAGLAVGRTRSLSKKGKQGGQSVKDFEAHERMREKMSKTATSGQPLTNLAMQQFDNDPTLITKMQAKKAAKFKADKKAAGIAKAKKDAAQSRKDLVDRGLSQQERSRTILRGRRTRTARSLQDTSSLNLKKLLGE